MASVLVIEDNAGLRDLIEHQLARLDGFEVTWAEDGERGLDTARVRTPT